MNEYVETLKSGLVRLWNGFVYIVVTYVPLLILFLIGSIGILELISVDTGIPDNIVPYWIPVGVTIWILLPVSEIVRQYIANPPKEYLHEVDPETGDAGVKELYPKQWEDLTVVDVVTDERGNYVELEKERADLHQIQIDTTDGAQSAYECEFYDSDENKAYVSFFGSVSGSEIRRHRNSTEYLKHEASAEKDVHQRLRNLYPDLVEKAVHERMNYYIHVVEGEQIGGQRSIRSIIDSSIKESELTEYVEEEADFSDMIDMENPFEEESEAKQYRQRTSEGDTSD
jgi:hypothetical protein